MVLPTSDDFLQQVMVFSNKWWFSPTSDGSPNKSWVSPTIDSFLQQVVVFANK